MASFSLDLTVQTPDGLARVYVTDDTSPGWRVSEGSEFVGWEPLADELVPEVVPQSIRVAVALLVAFLDEQ